MVWGDLPADGEKCAHTQRQHELHRLPLVVEPELLRLPPAAAGEPQDADAARRRRRAAELHRVQLPDAARRRLHARPRRRRDRQPDQPGPVELRHPRRSATTATARSIYVQQQTISAEGFGGIAFSTNVPHTVRGRGARETKQCTDCHLSQDERQQRLDGPTADARHGLHELHRQVRWVAAGEEGLFGVVVTEADRAAGRLRQRSAPLRLPGQLQEARRPAAGC